MHNRSRFLPLSFACLAWVCVASAEVKLAGLFTDHLVLQCDQAVPIWGTAKKKETVTVAFGSQKVIAKADREGQWRAVLAPLPASTTPADLVVTGSSTVTLHDVVVGEVWICSGQSNMEFSLRGTNNAEAEAAAARFPLIRHFKVEQAMAPTPAADVKGSWTVCSPETAPHFTAVGYFFARKIHARLGVPIGLLNTSWGGTPVEAWMSPTMLAANPQAAAQAAYWRRTVAEYPVKKATHDRAVAEWEQRAAAAKAAGQPEPPNRPWRPPGPGTPEEPSVLWNGMVAPLVPFAFRGVIWYQGEANAGRAASYRDLFSGLITGWRAAWAQAVAPAGKPKDKLTPPPTPAAPFPFLFVQLANWQTGNNANATDWALLREAQTQTLAVPATGMAVAIDIGDSVDIHPRNKQEVGRRLALLARSRVYDEGIDDSGPVYTQHLVEGNAIRLKFNHAQIGLVCHGPRLQGFTIAGADRNFVPATARIDGDSVVVSADAVKAPVAVRYGFANDPQPPPSLYNGAGLPAVPFRTDTW